MSKTVAVESRIPVKICRVQSEGSGQENKMRHEREREGGREGWRENMNEKTV